MEDKDKKNYSLYTEKIVKDDKKKKKNKGRRVVAIILIAGIAAFCIFALPMMIRSINHSINAGYSVISIEGNDMMPGESIAMTVDNNSADAQKGNYSEALVGMKEKINDIKKSAVYVSEESSSLVSDEETVARPGIIIGKTDTRYVIVTDSEAAGRDRSINVKFDNGEEIKGTFLASNETTGLSLISIKISDISEELKDNVIAVKTADSGKMDKGSYIIAYGDIRGEHNKDDYGIITEVGSADIPDSDYKKMVTDISSDYDDFAFLFNSNGSLVAVSSMQNEDMQTLEGLGISDLRKILEKMSKGEETVYLGVVGETVTEEIASGYNLPVGVYVKEVAINSPAYKSGIQAGDVITGIDDTEIKNLNDFTDMLYECANGQQVKLLVKRLGQNEYKDITFRVILKVDEQD